MVVMLATISGKPDAIKLNKAAALTPADEKTRKQLTAFGQTQSFREACPFQSVPSYWQPPETSFGLTSHVKN